MEEERENPGDRISGVLDLPAIEDCLDFSSRTATVRALRLNLPLAEISS